MEILFDRIMEDKENIKFLQLIMNLLDLTPVELQLKKIEYQEKARLLNVHDMDNVVNGLCNAILAYQNSKIKSMIR